MAINLDCPRCKARLRVPNKKAGGYVNCPHCQGRFWVDKAAAADATPADSVTLAVPPGISPPAAPPYVADGSSLPLGVSAKASAAPLHVREAISPGAMPVSPRISTSPSSTALPPILETSPAPAAVPLTPPNQPVKPKTPPVVNSAAPSAPPIISRPARKVARFIPAEAAQSTLQPTADGKLPELQLSDGSKKEEQEKKSSSLSPLALYGIVSLSLLLTVALLLLGDSSNSINAEIRAKAWSQIEANYFSDPGGNELKPYNILLREAKQAHLSQNRIAEHEMLGKVNDLLRAERGINEKGLTGSRDRDNKLKEHIMVLMNGLKQE